MGVKFTKENAREMQKRGAEAKKRNRAVKDVLREELSKKVGELTKLEWLTQKAIANQKDVMTFKDLKTIQEILGEAVSNLNIQEDGENPMIALTKAIEAMKTKKKDEGSSTE